MSIQDGAAPITALTLKTGESKSLTAQVLPANATNKAVSWRSSDPAIATVSDQGLVSAKAAGTATITVTTQDGSHPATLALTVGVPAASVRIDYFGVEGITSLTLLVGEKETMMAAVLPDDTTDKAVWGSSDISVATIDETTGAVEGKATGTAQISVTAGTQRAEFELTIAAAGTPPSIVAKTEPDLRLMARRPDATYTLAGDITLTKEWEPIGSLSGTIDGAGHTIKNLVINQPNNLYVGFIGANATTGVIKDLGVEVGAVGITGAQTVGALVSYNEGYVSGVVSGAGSVNSISNQPSGVGGLVGSNFGTAIGISLVAVNGGGNAGNGGLVGTNNGDTVKGYATGNVNGFSYTGGIVGNNFGGSVIGYYVRGTVQGTLRIGGLVGAVGGTLAGYSRGAVAVSSGQDVGRVVGLVYPTTNPSNAYYSSKTVESTFTAPTGVTPNSVGKSITIDSATKEIDFAGFDFTNDWEFFPGKWPAIRFPADQSIFNPYRGELQPIAP